MHLYAIIPVAGLSQDASYLFEALGCGLQSSHLGTEHCAMLNDFLKDVSHCLTTFNDSTGIKPPVGHLMSFKRCSKWVWYLYSWCFCKYFRGGFATTLPAFAPWTFDRIAFAELWPNSATIYNILLLQSANHWLSRRFRDGVFQLGLREAFAQFSRVGF